MRSSSSNLRLISALPIVKLNSGVDIPEPKGISPLGLAVSWASRSDLKTCCLCSYLRMMFSMVRSVTRDIVTIIVKIIAREVVGRMHIYKEKLACQEDKMGFMNDTRSTCHQK
jgi:hypothetical protein